MQFMMDNNVECYYLQQLQLGNSHKAFSFLNPHLGSHVLTRRFGERESCQEEGHHARVQSLPTERAYRNTYNYFTYNTIIFVNKPS